MSVFNDNCYVDSKLRWPTTVTAKPKTSRQNRKPHGKNKNLTAKPKTSRQKQNTSRQKRKTPGKNKNLTAKTKYLTTKPKTSRQKQRPHDKTKYFTAKTKYLTEKANTHSKTKAILLLLWSIWFSREVCCFCLEVFVFAVRYFVLILPWGFWFCRDSYGPPYKTISLSLVFNLHFQTKYLASLTNQNARFYSIMRFYSKLITVPKYLSAGNCRAFQKSPHV